MQHQGAWKMAQAAECFLYKSEGLGLDAPHIQNNPDMVLHTCNLSAKETEMRGFQVFWENIS